MRCDLRTAVVTASPDGLFWSSLGYHAAKPPFPGVVPMPRRRGTDGLHDSSLEGVDSNHQFRFYGVAPLCLCLTAT